MSIRSNLRMIPVGAAAYAADRIAKALVTRVDLGRSVPLINGVVSLTHVRNTGVAFSMFAGSQLPLIILTALIVAGVTVFALRGTGRDRLTEIGLWLVIGGGLGNLYDRIVYGSVIDFIRLDFVRFAVFNTADIFVCVGCVMALLGMLINERKERKNSAG